MEGRPSTQIKYYCAVTCEWTLYNELKVWKKHVIWNTFLVGFTNGITCSKVLLFFYHFTCPSRIKIHWFEPLRQTDKLHVLYFFGRNLADSGLDKRSTLWGKQAKLYVLFPQFSSLCTLDKRKEPLYLLFRTFIYTKRL